jgi:DNA polymerase-1
MKKVLIDASGLIYASGFIHGNMTRDSDDLPVGVLFGVLQTIFKLANDLKTNDFIFCLDSSASKRRDIYPDYKGNRKDKSKEIERILHQIPMLLKMLEDLGFKNLIKAHGYEADDLIAHYALNKEPDEKVVIVSSDEDMYQLLSKTVRMWPVRKKEWITEKVLMETYGCTPDMYLEAKIITGCGTDNVKGIDGVGIKKAVQFLCGEMNEKTKTFQKIQDNLDQIRKTNRILITIPFDGAVDVPAEDLELKDNQFVDDDTYLEIMTELQFDFMINNISHWRGFKKGRDVSKAGRRERVSRRMKKKGKK